MISSPRKPQRSDIISSVREEQSRRIPPPAGSSGSGVWGGLDGEELPVAGVPGESLVQAAGILPDSLFVVQVEWGGILLCDGLELLQGDKGLFSRADAPFSNLSGGPGPDSPPPQEKNRFYCIVSPIRCQSTQPPTCSPPGPSFGDSGKRRNSAIRLACLPLFWYDCSEMEGGEVHDRAVRVAVSGLGASLLFRRRAITGVIVFFLCQRK